MLQINSLESLFQVGGEKELAEVSSIVLCRQSEGLSREPACELSNPHGQKRGREDREPRTADGGPTSRHNKPPPQTQPSHLNLSSRYTWDYLASKPHCAAAALTRMHTNAHFSCFLTHAHTRTKPQDSRNTADHPWLSNWTAPFPDVGFLGGELHPIGAWVGGSWAVGCGSVVRQLVRYLGTAVGCGKDGYGTG